jgi:predicted anti-sigma-YlaC factor YlaD
MRSPADLTCSEVVEIVNDYLEHALTPEDSARLEQHLVLCEPCVTYVEQSRLTIAALQNLPRAPVSPDAREALMNAFRKLKRTDEP